MLIRIRGRSMVPALRPGDWVIGHPHWVLAPRRGTIVLLRLERETPGFFVKRVVGLPGEQIIVRDAAAWADGLPLEEPYVSPEATLEPKPEWTCDLGHDQYAVLGDARDDSLDSRRFGPVSRAEIKAFLLWRVWPLHRAGRLR